MIFQCVKTLLRRPNHSMFAWNLPSHWQGETMKHEWNAKMKSLYRLQKIKSNCHVMSHDPIASYDTGTSCCMVKSFLECSMLPFWSEPISHFFFQDLMDRFLPAGMLVLMHPADLSCRIRETVGHLQVTRSYKSSVRRSNWCSIPQVLRHHPLPFLERLCWTACGVRPSYIGKLPKLWRCKVEYFQISRYFKIVSDVLCIVEAFKNANAIKWE